MYVPGKLSDVERVLIDVGTGYYVEKVRGGMCGGCCRVWGGGLVPSLGNRSPPLCPVVEMMSQKIQQLTALGAAQGATTKA
ncbi:PFD5 protein, partial [Sula dactylatra]|nr:PFD5 protein [Sula dactylatra]